MTEQEFVDIVPQLRALALQKALSYPSASDWADDVAQDSLIKMWALRESVSSRQHALGLVATMARHLTIDRLRKEHTVGLEQARNIAATERASERVEEESYGKWLDKALKNCRPPNTRCYTSGRWRNLAPKRLPPSWASRHDQWERYSQGQENDCWNK